MIETSPAPSNRSETTHDPHAQTRRSQRISPQNSMTLAVEKRAGNFFIARFSVPSLANMPPKFTIANARKNSPEAVAPKSRPTTTASAAFRTSVRARAAIGSRDVSTRITRRPAVSKGDAADCRGASTIAHCSDAVSSVMRLRGGSNETDDATGSVRDLIVGGRCRRPVLIELAKRYVDAI